MTKFCLVAYICMALIACAKRPTLELASWAPREGSDDDGEPSSIGEGDELPVKSLDGSEGGSTARESCGEESASEGLPAGAYMCMCMCLNVHSSASRV